MPPRRDDDLEFQVIVRMLARRVVLAGLIVLGAAAPSYAQLTASSELVTDRPDFTESSEVVGHLVLQVESGFTFETIDETLRQMTVPQVLLRVGLGRRFELRFAADGLLVQSADTPDGRVRANGGSDIEIGAQLKFLDADAAGVDMTVIPFLSLPTATPGFGAEGTIPGFKLTVARDLPRGFGLSGNYNVASLPLDDERAWEQQASVSLGHGLGGPVGAYWEVYGAIGDGRCDCTVNTGVTIAAGANAQFDVEVGRGVSGDAPDWFVGAGFAIRTPIR